MSAPVVLFGAVSLLGAAAALVLLYLAWRRRRRATPVGVRVLHSCAAGHVLWSGDVSAVFGRVRLPVRLPDRSSCQRCGADVRVSVSIEAVW